MFTRLSASSLLMLVAALMLTTVGCSGDPKNNGGDPQAKAQPKKDPDTWWCKEHGIPEDICSLCNAEHAEKLKKEGDWCKDHDRAKSQCFKCDPSKYEKFEAMYVAEFNKKPERPPAEEFQK